MTRPNYIAKFTVVPLWFVLLVFLFHQVSQSSGNLQYGKEESKLSRGKLKNSPDKKTQLQVGLPAYVDKYDPKQFQEELRSALSSHWILLQKIRYHAVISKMKVAELDKKIKNLAQQIENKGIKSTKEILTAPCDKEFPEDAKTEIQTPGEENMLEVANLRASLEELSHFYEGFNYTTGSFNEHTAIEVRREKFLQLLERLRPFVGNSTRKDPSKRLTRKSTNALNGTIISTFVTKDTLTTPIYEALAATSSSVPEDAKDKDKEDDFTEDVISEMGRTASFRCHIAVRRPTGTVVWTKANKFGTFDMLAAGQYFYSDDSRYAINYEALSKVWVLSIRNVALKDAGLYRCEVNSIPAFVSKSFRLIVEEEAKPSIDIDATVDVEAVKGTTAELNCRINNMGQHSVSWRGTDHYGNSVLLTYGVNTYSSDQRIRLYHNLHSDGSYDWTLVIHSVGKADEGQYTCSVNAIPSVSRVVSLTILDEEHPRTTSAPLYTPPSYQVINVTVSSGRSVTFNCSFESHFEGEDVSWIRPGDEVRVFSSAADSSNKDHRISASQTKEHELLLAIHNVEATDEGEYKCLQLPSPDSQWNTVVLQIVYLTVDIRPYIVKDGDNNVTSEEGSTALLHCQVGNLDSHTVAWMRMNSGADSDILTVGLDSIIWDPRISVEVDAASNDWMLKITNVSPLDSGNYECQINIFPLVSHSVNLHVVEASPVTFTPSLVYNFTAEEGETAVLPCRIADLGDASVSWSRLSDLQVLTAGEFTLSPDGRFRTRTADNVTWNLQISDVQQRDEGEYLCQASTKPVTSSKFWLQVRSKTSVAMTKVLASSSSSSTTEASHCLPPFEIIPSGRCLLQVTTMKLSWTDAMLYCRSYGGELVIDPDESLKSFLEEQHGMKATNWNMWPFWVGAREDLSQHGERLWTWVDGTSVNSRIWAPSQPRRYGRRKAPRGSCMTLDGYQGYLAAALPCQHRRRFLCLKD